MTKGIVMPAPKEHAAFWEQYYCACQSSNPEDYVRAALLAKQWEQAIIAEIKAAARAQGEAS